MKKQKQKRPHGKSGTSSAVILDEYHLFAPAGGAMAGVLAMGLMRKPGARRMIATQAFMKFNSGKRLRFIGSSRWEDTGELVKLAPKKFLPAQALRRETAMRIRNLKGIVGDGK